MISTPLSLADPRRPAGLRAVNKNSPIATLHLVIVAVIAAGITILYYTWQDWFPWFWSYFMYEFRNHIIGSLYVVPLVYAAICCKWIPAAIIWGFSLAALFPRLVHYYIGYNMGSLMLNLAVLSVPLTIVIIIGLEIDWRQKKMEAARQLEAERQTYMSQILRAQEEERRHIAQELHDDTIQELLVLANRMEDLVLETSSIGPGVREKSEWVRDRTVALCQSVRRLSLDLGPSILDDVGLVPALTWLADRLTMEASIKTKVVVEGAYTKKMFAADVETTIFRIVQEALSNVRRHSRATSAEVSLEFRDGSLSVTVCDNGKGFVLPKNSADLTAQGKLGLANMQQRARFINGDLNIDTGPGKGTIVSLRIAE